MRRLLVAVYVVVAVCTLWLPGCGSVAFACRPWKFTEQRFGLLGYYRARISRDGAYAEGFEPENLCLTIVLSVVVLALSIAEYRRSRRRSLG